METLREQMNALNTEEGWEKCVDMLENGPAKPAKRKKASSETRKKRIAISPKPSPLSTPKQRRHSRRLSKKQRKEDSDDEESDKDQSIHDSENESGDDVSELRLARSSEVQFQNSPEMSSVKKRRQ
jgi:hypothetical protein